MEPNDIVRNFEHICDMIDCELDCEKCPVDNFMDELIAENLVYNDDKVREFAKILPELGENEVFVGAVIARRKYDETVEKSQRHLVKEIFKKNDPDYVLNKIKGMCAKAMTFGYPSESLAVYFDMNPKNTRRAFADLVKDGIDFLYMNDSKFFGRISDVYYGALAKHNSKKLFWMIDLDSKDKEVYDEIREIVGIKSYCITETRGGYHFIVYATSEMGRLLHKEVKPMKDVEIQRQALTVVPGTLQGGFKVMNV